MTDTDDCIYAALEELLQDPPAELIRLVRKKCKDKRLTAAETKSELQRHSVVHRSSFIAHRSAFDVYQEIERYCLELEPDAVRPQLWKPAVQISFLKGSRAFCDVSVFTGGMRVRLRRNHELAVRTLDDLESAKPLIREAFEAA